MSHRLFALILCLATLLSGCGYNQIQINDEDVNAAWSEVLNQYKRRADLVPNLVATVQAYAAHEKDVFTQVAQARASIGGIQATPELINDSAAFAKFQSAQAGDDERHRPPAGGRRKPPTTQGRRRISATCRRNWKAWKTASLSRATRYIDAVRTYNVSVRTFPNNLTAMVMGWQPKANFSVDNEKAISDAPSVNFGSK